MRDDAFVVRSSHRSVHLAIPCPCSSTRAAVVAFAHGFVPSVAGARRQRVQCGRHTQRGMTRSDRIHAERHTPRNHPHTVLSEAHRVAHRTPLAWHAHVSLPPVRRTWLSWLVWCCFSTLTLARYTTHTCLRCVSPCFCRAQRVRRHAPQLRASLRWMLRGWYCCVGARGVQRCVCAMALICGPWLEAHNTGTT